MTEIKNPNNKRSSKVAVGVGDFVNVQQMDNEEGIQPKQNTEKRENDAFVNVQHPDHEDEIQTKKNTEKRENDAFVRIEPIDNVEPIEETKEHFASQDTLQKKDKEAIDYECNIPDNQLIDSYQDMDIEHINGVVQAREKQRHNLSKSRGHIASYSGELIPTIRPCVKKLKQKQFKKLIQKSIYKDLHESKVCDSQAFCLYISANVFGTVIFLIFQILMAVKFNENYFKYGKEEGEDGELEPMGAFFHEWSMEEKMVRYMLNTWFKSHFKIFLTPLLIEAMLYPTKIQRNCMYIICFVIYTVLMIYLYITNMATDYSATFYLFYIMFIFIIVQWSVLLCKEETQKVTNLVFGIIFLAAFMSFLVVQLLHLKNANPIIPIGTFFIVVQFFMTNLVRVLLFFGIRNNLAVVNLAQLTFTMIKITGISLNFLDVVMAEQRWLQIVYLVVMVINQAYLITYFHILYHPVLMMVNKIFAIRCCQKCSQKIVYNIKRCLNFIAKALRLQKLSSLFKKCLNILDVEDEKYELNNDIIKNLYSQIEKQNSFLMIQVISMFVIRLIMLLTLQVCSCSKTVLVESRFPLILTIIAFTLMLLSVVIIDKVKKLRLFMFYDAPIRSLVEQVLFIIYLYGWMDQSMIQYVPEFKGRLMHI